MKASVISVLLAVGASLAGCVTGRWEPVPTAHRYEPAPDRSRPPATQFVAARRNDSTARDVPAKATTGPAATTAPSTPAPVKIEIDPATRDALAQAALQQILTRYPPSTDARLKEYLILVGSLLVMDAPAGQGDYQYVVLETDRPVSFAAAPNTIAVSRGLLSRMRDEAELAGVLAREIANLRTDRAMGALGLNVTDAAGAAPDRGMVERYADRLAELLLSQNLPPAQTEVADLQGARLAAGAKYAPDGYLRLLARLNPDASPGSPIWERLRTLDANVSIVAKANPAADVRLPVRFESYVKRPAK